MTGLHTGHAYIRGNNGNADGTDMHLRANDTTLPELLQSNGYHTSLFGKWGLGFNDTEGAPNVKGFDKFYGELDQANAHNMYPPFLWRDTEKVRNCEERSDELGKFSIALEMRRPSMRSEATSIKKFQLTRRYAHRRRI